MKNFFVWRLWLLLVVLLSGVSARAQSWAWASRSTHAFYAATATDFAGNVLVAGTLYDSATFGATTLRTYGNDNQVLVAKLNPAGQFLWAVQAGSRSVTPNTSPRHETRAQAVATDAVGNVLVAGYFQDTMVLGSITLISHRYQTAFVAKLSPAGAWLWAVPVATERAAVLSTITGIAVDGGGNVLVAGSYVKANHDSCSVRCGPFRLHNAGYGDAFVAKLSPTGAWLWAKNEGGPAEVWGIAVAVDRAGFVWLAGTYAGAAQFGAQALRGRGHPAYVARLSPTGTWMTAASASGPSDVSFTAAAADGAGNVLLTGHFQDSVYFAPRAPLTGVNQRNQGSLFVAKLTPVGTWAWVTGADGAGNASGEALAVDSAGQVFVAGSYASVPLRFGNTTLTGDGGLGDLFVARLSAGGVWQAAISAGGDNIDQSKGLSLSPTGALAVAGYFFGTGIRFGPIALSNPNPPLVAASFVAQLDARLLATPVTVATSAFTLAPNPARTTVQLTGAAGEVAHLFDALGREMRTVPLTQGAATLAVAGLPAGLYVVRAGQQVRRLVVE